MILLTSEISPAFFLIALPIFLYAEIHYRFKGMPSRLFMREPEIIADVPHRLEPGAQLAILLIIKDAKRFPLRLRSITANIVNESGECLFKTLCGEPQIIQSYYWWQVELVTLPPSMIGNLRIDVTFEYETQQGKIKRAVNDNYRGVSHAPLQCHAAAEPLPILPGYISGDVHFHSDGTDDQVEFGAPLEATALMARAMGLQFFAATDHSYDIDDQPENYLKNDPDLKRWHAQRKHIFEWNAQQNGVIILPGEEVSCANRGGRNVHFLILDHSQFLPGSGDGAEHWFRTRAELSIEEILNQLDENAAAFGAHPRVKAPILEWLLLRRGRWRREDFLHSRLDGLQIWNGHPDGAEDGLREWRELLLSGKKLALAAGNDAHGNFSRFRQVGFPFFKMREHRLNIFGRARTVVRRVENNDAAQIIAALREGKSCISTGPMIDLQIFNHDGKVFSMGDTAIGDLATVKVTALSTHEFGEIEDLRIWFGDLAARKEKLFFSKSDFKGETAFNTTLPLQSTRIRRGYFRSELTTKINETTLPDIRLSPQVLSNPVWVNDEVERV
jgi:hypothetical protein